VDPWDRPAPQGRPDDWNQGGRAPAGGWETVLPPVGGAPGEPERGGAGVDEATAFMSQWGPPPLRPTEEQAGSPEWGRPSPPSRAGAGRSADNPVAPPRNRPDWSGPAGPSSALPPVADAPSAGSTQLPTAPSASPAGGPRPSSVPPAQPTGDPRIASTPRAQPTDGPRPPSTPLTQSTGGPRIGSAPPAQPAGGPQLPSAPTEPAAERWIADRLAADRSAAGAGADEDFAGYWATDRPAKRRTRPAGQEDSATDRRPNRSGTDVRFAG
jgi:hypothetical protein